MSDVNKQLLEALKRLLHKAYKQNWQDNYPFEVECAEEAIAAAEKAQQAEPVAWEVRNGVAAHDFYRSEAEAEEVARDMQKSHDLSGSLAAFNVHPVYAQPPAVAVAVPDGYALVPIEPTQAMLDAGQKEWFESAGADPSFDMYRAMLSAALDATTTGAKCC